jgi:phospho-N-acetylmuramoyl-pentapeptide-transferase
MLALFLYQLTGIHLFDDRTFRAGASSLVAALLVFLTMPLWIRWLQKLDATSDFDDGKTAPPPILGGALLIAVVAACSILLVGSFDFICRLLFNGRCIQFQHFL